MYGLLATDWGIVKGSKRPALLYLINGFWKKWQGPGGGVLFYSLVLSAIPLGRNWCPRSIATPSQMVVADDDVDFFGPVC
jgi:hypothetical protein